LAIRLQLAKNEHDESASSSKARENFAIFVTKQKLELTLNRPRCSVASLDHLVGAGEKWVRHVEAQRFRGREIDDEFELGWLLDREIAGLCTM
jgi:hypothetical protein